MTRYLNVQKQFKNWPCCLLLLFSAIFSVPLQAENTAISIKDWGVDFQFESAISIKDPRLQKLEFITAPSIELEFNHNIELFASARMRWDIRDNLEPGHAEQNEISHQSQRLLLSDNGDLELREFYLTSDLGEGLLMIGKQAIVWGTSDGLRVLDVVNPFSFREFILDDFKEARIPTWGLNYILPIHQSELQILWLFDQSYNDFPQQQNQGLFKITSPRFVPTGSPPPGVRIIRDKREKPSRFIKDSDLGLRLSSTIAGWDFTLNYLYHYHDNALPVRSISISSTGPELHIKERYFRTHLIGGTFSTAIDNFVLRGEVGFSTARYFLTTDNKNLKGIKKSSELSYVLGIDWSGLDDTFISAQLFQSILTASANDLVRPQTDTSVSALYQRNFMNESLQFQLFGLHNINDGDGFFRPKFKYNVTDGVNAKIGIDFFYGSKKGVFGEFKKSNRVTFGMEWFF